MNAELNEKLSKLSNSILYKSNISGNFNDTIGQNMEKFDMV